MSKTKSRIRRRISKKEKNENNGVKEWANASANLFKGCWNNCKYCYAKRMLVNRCGKTTGKTLENWTNMDLNERVYNKKFRKNNGRAMFPTSHDITVETVDKCIEFLIRYLCVGNSILIVSKPKFECVEKLCNELLMFKNNIEFRFSIGTKNDEILKFWEPNASSYIERKESLKLTYNNGFVTSVSCEPRLNEDTVELFEELNPFISNTFWIGKMNNVWHNYFNEAELTEYRRIQSIQTDTKIFELYNQMKNIGKIRWKDSIKKVVGISLLEKAGLDQ